MPTTASTHPVLAPPGAGIPAIERTVGRIILSLRLWLGDRRTFADGFAREQATIERLYLPLDDQARACRVLIPRLRGLEDSSRFWSVWMTLDHLRIVNSQIRRVIAALCDGTMPAGKASTAMMKPSESVDGGVVEAYEESCRQLATTVASSSELKTRLRYAHPWFGPLDALGWHAMSAMHMSIHRAQIARIIAGFPSSAA